MPLSLLTIASTAARWLPAPLKRLGYHLGPLTRILRSALNRAAPQGLTVVSVAGGGLQGARLMLDMQSEKDYWLGTYEMALQDAIRDWVKAGWIAYDVGANVGYVTLLLARQVGAGGRVIAFEALPANLERLKTHIEMNDASQQVTVEPYAVGRGDGTARFHVGVSDDTGRLEGSAGRITLKGESIEVPVLSLDTYAYERKNQVPQVVKMDIEGGEVLAVAGMRHLLKENRPLMLIEIHSAEAAKTVWEHLSDAGYRIYRMEKGYAPVASLAGLGRKAYVVARAE